jgi:hypothetical protein
MLFCIRLSWRSFKPDFSVLVDGGHFGGDRVEFRRPAVIQSSATLRPVTGAESTGDQTRGDIAASRVLLTQGTC